MTSTPLEPTRQHVWHRKGFRKIFANTGWLLVDRVVRLALNLVVGAWVARYLKPEGFGLLNSAASLLGIVGALAGLGLEKIVIRDLVRAPERTAEILSASVQLRLMGGLIGYAIALISAIVLEGTADATVGLVAILGVGMILTATDIFDLWFQSIQESKYLVFARAGAFAVHCLLRIGLIIGQFSVFAFAVSELVQILIGGVLLILFYKRVRTGPLWSPARKERMLGLLKDSWPQAFSQLAIMVYMRIDVLMVKAYCGETDCGIYSAAVRLSEIWFFVPMAFVSATFPSILRYREISRSLYHHRMGQMFAVMSAMALSVSVFIAFASRPLVQLLFGQAYVAAGPILTLHIWSSLFVFWGVAQEPWNVGEGLQKMSMVRTIAGAIVNVVLNILLIPRYTGWGAAVSTVIAYGVATVGANALQEKTRPIFYLQVQSLIFPMFFLPQIKSILRSVLPPAVTDWLRDVRDRVSDSHVVKSYSLEGEDVVLRRLLGDQKTGFFVDVGAHAPKRFSNTYRYYQAGWRGINIDADPDCVKVLQKYRPRDINVCAAVSSDGRTLKFHRYQEKAFNSLSPEFASARAAGDPVDIATVETLKLADILSKHLPSGQTIDFMSIDVEGMDLEVLQGNDWKKFRPRFILVECFGDDLRAVLGSDISLYLERLDYTPAAKTANTVVFAHMDALNTAEN